MATATQDRTKQARQSSKTSKTKPNKAEVTVTALATEAIPELASLTAIAAKTGITQQQIAAEIRSLGNLAFYDAGTYKAPVEAVEAWADAWLDRDRAERRAALLAVNSAVTVAAPSNGRVEASPEPTVPAAAVEAPKRGRKPAVVDPNRPRLKDFSKSNSYQGTLDNFRAAQKYSDLQWTEAIEQMVQETNLGNYYLQKMLGKYPTNQRKVAKQGILSKLKGITGTPEAPAAVEAVKES